MQAENLFEIGPFPDGTVLSYWTGLKELIFNGNTYSGSGNAINISSIEEAVGVQSKRAQVSISIPDNLQLVRFAEDQGPVPVKVNWIFSNDNGATWTLLPKVFVGRISNPYIENRVYLVELETYTGDVDSGDVKYWSHESQQARFPGDRGFEYVREIAGGIDIEWPP